MTPNRCALALRLECDDSMEEPNRSHVAQCPDCAEAWVIRLLRSEHKASQVPAGLPSASLLWVRQQMDVRSAREHRLFRLTSAIDWIAIAGGSFGLLQILRSI